MKDRKQDIINAALVVLREHGLSGFTQPRVAAGGGSAPEPSHLLFPYTC